MCNYIIHTCHFYRIQMFISVEFATNCRLFISKKRDCQSRSRDSWVHAVDISKRRRDAHAPPPPLSRRSDWRRCIVESWIFRWHRSTESVAWPSSPGFPTERAFTRLTMYVLERSHAMYSRARDLRVPGKERRVCFLRSDGRYVNSVFFTVKKRVSLNLSPGENGGRDWREWFIFETQSRHFLPRDIYYIIASRV